jgi:hypothetical protein
MVKESLSMTHGDPSIEFAAALITAGRARGNAHADHVQNARTGATENQLLARNIALIQ